MRLTKKQLKQPNIQRLISGEKPLLTENQLMSERPLVIKALLNEKIFHYLVQENPFLSLEQIRTIKWEQTISLIDDDECFSLFTSKKIFSLEALFNLTSNLTRAFLDKNFYSMFTQTPPVILPKEIQKLSAHAILALKNKGVQALIMGTNPKVSKGKLFKLSENAYVIFANSKLRHLMMSDRLPINQDDLFNLSRSAATLFKYSETIPLMLANPPFIPYTGESFSHDGSAALALPGVRRLLVQGTLTREQLADIRYETLDALRDEATMQRLLNGELTVAQVIGGAHNPGGRRGLEVFYNQQNTHTASVHRSVSATALKLYNRYKKKLNDEEFLLIKIKEWSARINERNEELKAGAAFRCIERFFQPGIKHVDPKSRVSVHQFLALAWIAIHDEALRCGSLDDAEEQFKEMLYEIQRGYNIIARNIDNGENDSPICMGGTFNKICEKLVGIHPDAELIIVTKNQAAAKLPQKVKEKAIAYLEKLIRGSIPGHQDILQKFEEAGVAAIWKDINQDIHKELFDEFGEAFGNDQYNKEFVDMVEVGIDVDLSSEVESLKNKLRENQHITSINEEDYNFTDMDASSIMNLGRSIDTQSLIDPLSMNIEFSNLDQRPAIKTEERMGLNNYLTGNGSCSSIFAKNSAMETLIDFDNQMESPGWQNFFRNLAVKKSEFPDSPSMRLNNNYSPNRNAFFSLDNLQDKPGVMEEEDMDDLDDFDDFEQIKKKLKLAWD